MLSAMKTAYTYYLYNIFIIYGIVCSSFHYYHYLHSDMSSTYINITTYVVSSNLDQGEVCELRWDIIVNYFDIDEIVDHHWLNFLFII
jgi:hypothetical protein